MLVSSLQMDIVPGDPAANRANVAEAVRQEADNTGPDIIVLPEMWTTAYTLPELPDTADYAGSRTIPFLQELAVKHGVHLIGGSIAWKENGDIFNRALVINKHGKLIYQYDKLHLVPMLDEPAYLTGGRHKCRIFELDGIKMGVVICYDLRFPELLRHLALQGAQVIFVVAEWPDARRDHWYHLQIARAIENQCYIVSCNRIGSYNDIDFAGTSMVINPSGHVLAQGHRYQEQSVRSSIQPAQVPEVRKQVPIFESRRPEFYE
ncbi:carbon-nitrogen family hydrolase [Salibacterium qingdaonense]|uniref:Carbon-nitrogen hydrolase n=1 Tax=Salibacterium qingdaonense TaxID=266892 RepID=A0A1I4P112_9BACI|nr:carbon-nitrogen family hydrolase [Salibacterium qingdaonense]SFM21336.1 Carbon-nitrogen hydrolase [Salibacterium qingdaonense]